MKIVFRVDASTQMGIGHVMRCLTLAKALKENSAEVEFICRAHQGNLIDKIKIIGFNVSVLELESQNKPEKKLAHSNWLGETQEKDAIYCSNILKNIQPDWIIVDHYGLDEDWHLVLRDYCRKIMVIDDLSDRKHQCDVLLDQTFGCQKSNYNFLVPETCKLLLGSKYVLLRPEFLKWRKYSLSRRNSSELKNILINMGGTDPDNVTGKILDEFATFEPIDNIKITIIMGKDSPHLESVNYKSNSLIYNSEVKVNVDNMAEIMANSDLAIGASGATSWERCCLVLPSIQVIIANNQKNIARNLEEKKIIKLLKSFDQLKPTIDNITKNLSNYSNNAQQIIDGKGVKRVLNILYE
jgi:UDP-2,4-diacetamido-2,4,6-trideoxy-beta-L-altropyranose hydrolase